MPDTSAPRAATAAPRLTEPADGAVVPLDAVTFRWAAPPGADVFDLRVAAAAAPDAPLVELDGLPTTETTLADALPAAELVWWVRRSGGAWSAPARFVAGTAADLAVAVQAEAERADAARAEARAARVVPEPLAAPPDPEWPYAEGEALPGAPALDWAAVPGFGAPDLTAFPRAEAPAPAVVAPLGGAVVDAAAVVLQWTVTPGADRYQVELSPHAAFDRDVLTLDAGASTELVLPELVPAVGRRVLWRVRAHVGEAATPWSRYGRFYPAGGEAASAFSNALDRARAAERRRREHARHVAEAERDLVPLWERGDPLATDGTLVALLAMVATGVVIGIAAVAAVALLS